MAKTYNVQSYKNQLGYGARTNLFSVDVQIPIAVTALRAFNQNLPIADAGQPTASPPPKQPDIKIGGVSDKSKEYEKVNMMCHAVKFPKPRDLELDTIEYRGEFIQLAKKRGSLDEVTMSFRDSTDFAVRNLFETWINMIVNPKNFPHLGVKAHPLLYKAFACDIRMLNNNFQTIRKATLWGVWPSSIGGYDLNYENGAITETLVTLKYDSIDFNSDKDGRGGNMTGLTFF